MLDVEKDRCHKHLILVLQGILTEVLHIVAVVAEDEEKEIEGVEQID